jgi:hypothetical protein
MRSTSFVVVTSRSLAEVQRLSLPGGGPRRLLYANGAGLLVDGRVDPAHGRWLAELATESASLPEVHLSCADEARRLGASSSLLEGKALRFSCVDAATAARLGELVEERAARRGWVVTCQGRKVYLMPRGLSKGAAVRRLMDVEDVPFLAAAGDSPLDASMLVQADWGMVPRDSYLDLAGWRADHVRVTAEAGVRAGAQISAWLATQLDDNSERGARGTGDTPRRLRQD